MCILYDGVVAIILYEEVSDNSSFIEPPSFLAPRGQEERESQEEEEEEKEEQTLHVQTTTTTTQ